jgi:exosome complex exonuclease DIS3/RRP44
LGIEGVVIFKGEIEFDPDSYKVTIPTSKQSKGGKAISVFDKVTVNIIVEKDQNTQRGKVKMSLLSPVNSDGL